MNILDGFADKDMIEQIAGLDEIRENRTVEAIPALLDLYAKPADDMVVHEMIYHTLSDLLSGREDDIIAGLAHPSEAVRLLCVRRAVDGGSSALKDALVRLLADTQDNELTAEILRALVAFQGPDLADALLPYLTHQDYGVVAWAMRGLSGVHDDKIRQILMQMISQSPEAADGVSGCDLRTALAIENLARFNDSSAAEFLINFIHHANPSFRRVVLSALASMGTEALPSLARCLADGCRDEKIMAANVIGMTGQKQGVDVLLSQLEKAGGDTNLRFAIYEAMGRIRSIRSVIGLSDGLNETDELVLLAVVTGLNQQCNPGVIKNLNEIIARNDEHAKRVLAAIVTAHAETLFVNLYKDGAQRQALLEAVRASANHEAQRLFQEELARIGSEEARRDMATLETEKDGADGRRVLAADDSKAMLSFYKGAAADLGLTLITAEDGRQALDLLNQDDRFDLIITDLNMPNMDGIELTRELRKKPRLTGVPVLMATTESESGQVELARQAGVSDFISKPFSKEDFKTKIGQLLSKQT